MDVFHRVAPGTLPKFGGAARYVSHWSGLADGGSGHCFPAGRAATGSSLFGGNFAFRRSDRSLALAWWILAGASGLLLGLAQQWRGAHFMSHTLWSGVACWCTALAIDAAWPARTEIGAR